VWGPAIWHFLYTIAFNYPVNPTDTDKDVYAMFILNLGKVLPCLSCREHFPENLRDALQHCNYEAMTSRDRFSRFIHDFHVRVNRGRSSDTSGRSMPPPYETIRDTFSRIRAGGDGDGAPRKCVVSVPFSGI
jgi:hypothetical protein